MIPIRLVVFDLDNTLYDWVTYFAQSFYRMVDVAADLLGADRDTLLDELQSVHRARGNSEHPFALLETPSVQTRFPGLSRFQLMGELDDAFHAFNSARASTLQAYPGVKPALERLTDSGCLIAAHTEATADNAVYRLERLGITEHFARIYAPPPRGQGHPDPVRQQTFDDLLRSVAFLDGTDKKPNPQTAAKICQACHIPVGDALYVGDSIVKDIGMAKDAGMRTAWAKYGTLYDHGLWSQLVRITHWTSEDVLRAERAKERYAEVKADAVLHSSLEELFEHFRFGQFGPGD